VITHALTPWLTGCASRRHFRLEPAVILTGAMSPLGFEKSDGLQNLTESLFAARLLGLESLW